MTNQVLEVNMIPLARYQRAAVFNPFEHFVFFGCRGSGKTFCGAHRFLDKRIKYPGNEFLVGANSYDQLSQATLAELYYWMQEYGFEWVQDRRPPQRYGRVANQKTYRNTLTVYDPRSGKASLGFTRVLSEPDNIRGIEFEDYWLDESRDTTQYAHDMVLACQRGYPNPTGYISTTTNGEDWVYSRFVLGARKGDKMYGSMHVDIDQAVREGVLTEKYKRTLLRSFTPLMAEQELYAKHVNVWGGRAYYAFTPDNKAHTAPWGDEYPDPDRPLIIGCDFNYTPAPCVWIVGQVGPGEWSDHVHWFKEVSDVEISTQEMTMKLISQFPGFFYEVYGDASGKRGTTSNAGQTDYDQMGLVFAEHNCLYSIDVNLANPKRRDRVENTNRMAKNALGEIRLTYDPNGCPLLDGDVKVVGWKRVVREGGNNMLDDMGDNKRTHSTDAAGYVLWKKFPPGALRQIVPSLQSEYRKELEGVV